MKIAVLLIGVAASAILCLSGCQTSSGHRGIRVSDEEIYVKRCADCHKSYPASFYQPERWETFLKKHPKQRKDRARRDEMEAIRRFLEL